MDMKQTLSNADLQKLWANWLLTLQGQHISGYGLMMNYDTQHRNYGPARSFEDWLFSQGAVVKQVNGKRHLEFMKPEQATWFKLKWL
jgi:hypothetical protein